MVLGIIGAHRKLRRGVGSTVHCGNVVAVLRSAFLTVSCTAESPGFAFQGGFVLKISQV